MTDKPKAFVAYLRVSTSRQGESGLGLEAQRAAVTAFAQGQGAEIHADMSRFKPARAMTRSIAGRSLPPPSPMPSGSRCRSSSQSSAASAVTCISSRASWSTACRSS